MLTYSLHSYSMVAATQVQEVHSAYFPTIPPPPLHFHPSNVIHTHIHMVRESEWSKITVKKNYHDWNNVTILLQATYGLGYLEKQDTQNSSIKNINICTHTNTICLNRETYLKFWGFEICMWRGMCLDHAILIWYWCLY